jgi:predicted ATPase
LTRFFGREEEINRLMDLLLGDRQAISGSGFSISDWAGDTDGLSNPKSKIQSPKSECRLITLTGPGGSGKTRLALEVARQLRVEFHGAVWFVPLQDLTEARLIPDKLLDVLRLPRSPQLPPIEQAVAFLSGQPSLLLLDNFEHLVTEGAPLVQALLEQVPTLTCLVTSRQRLSLAGEQEFLVAPLPVPVEDPDPSRDREGAVIGAYVPLPHGRGSDRSTLAQCTSVRLFVDRAQAVQPHFQITARNAEAVAALCRRLEGLLLALELAAARVAVLTPAQMLELLSRRFDLLASSQRGVVPRHRSLRAALEWSYQLLSPELQRFFARLSVFQGGWTLEAAEAVCEEPQALDFLQQLRECTLVQPVEDGGEMRFRLLETLREYGAEQLVPEEQAAVAHRHASYYLALAERAEPELVRGEQIAWLDRLERELDNIRKALAWFEGSGHIHEALRLGGALHEFWHVRGDMVEGLALLRRLLALPGAEARTSARAKALNAAGVLAQMVRDYGTSVSLHEEGLAIGRELDDRWNIAYALSGLGMTLNNVGDLDAARPRFEEALTIWKEVGDSWGVTFVLFGLGHNARGQSDHATSRAHFEECLRILRLRGDRWGIALALGCLGRASHDQGDYAQAQSLWESSLAVAQELGCRSMMSGIHCQLGLLAQHLGRHDGALSHLQEALALAQELGDRPRVHDSLCGLARVALEQGDLGRARALLQEGEVVARAIGNRLERFHLREELGHIARDLGDYERAAALYRESLAPRREAGLPFFMILSLEDFAILAAHQGQGRRAVRLFGAAEAQCEAIGNIPPLTSHLHYEWAVATARAALGDDAFAAAWAAGRALTLQEAAAEALGEIVAH